MKWEKQAIKGIVLYGWRTDDGMLRVWRATYDGWTAELITPDYRLIRASLTPCDTPDEAREAIAWLLNPNALPASLREGLETGVDPEA